MHRPRREGELSVDRPEQRRLLIIPDAGSIHVALPIASSFILNASTDIGTVRNHFGTNLVGDTPQAELELHTHLGSVVVQCTETI